MLPLVGVATACTGEDGVVVTCVGEDGICVPTDVATTETVGAKGGTVKKV